MWRKNEMVIGSYETCIKKGILRKAFTKICGTLDFHSHIRLRPLIKYLKRKKICGNFLEIGCGSGLVAFELSRRGYVSSYIGIDTSEKCIDRAVLIRDSLNIDNIIFLRKNAFEFLNSAEAKDKKPDYVILYDFIEHIPTPEKFVKELLNCIGNDWGGTFIVSVPTPNYPKVFGEKFHKEIGHLVDGYKKNELDELFASVGYKNIYFEYSTGLLGNIGAYIYYHVEGKIKRILLYFLMLPFRLFDINSPKISSSLFAVYTRL